MKRWALVTGASAGLGVEFATQLAAQGYNLVLVARRLVELTKVQEQLVQAFDCDVEVLVADLSKSNAPDALYQELQNKGIEISYLVNNAGAGGMALADGQPWQRHAQYLELMMLSVTHMCHLFLPAMLKQGFGRIVNVSSVAGRIARAGDTHYGPSKTYLVALSEGLNATYKKLGVHSCALCPGFTHTQFHKEGELRDMKAALPKFIWYNPDVVVQEGLRAVERGKSVYVSGRMYRWLDGLFQFKLTRPLFVMQRTQGNL